MRILVIGAGGYIGSHVAAALTADGHDVVALRRSARYATVDGDLLDPASLTAAASTVDVVVHCGPPLGDADLPGADALIAAGRPVLHTTGAAVLGRAAGGVPLDEDSPADPHPLAAVRPEIERRVRAAGGWIIRPGMVYGNGGGLVPGLLGAKAAERGTGVYIGPPGVRWPVVHVDDLAALYPLVLRNAEPGTVWHGMAETVRLDAVAEVLGGGSATSWPLGAASADLGLLADLFTRDQVVSSVKTRQRLGWRPAHTSMLAELRPVSGSEHRSNSATGPG